MTASGVLTNLIVFVRVVFIQIKRRISGRVQKGLHGVNRWRQSEE
jgi:hypothetical protein